MYETTIEVKKADVPFIEPELRLTTNGKELMVIEIQEDANDPILTIRCGSVDQ